MKNIKKILTLAPLVCLTIIATAVMSSCEIFFGTEPTPEHQHSLSEVAEVAASCTEAGTKAYYTCSDCDKLFADAEGKTEIEAPEAIEKLEHVDTDPKDHECDVCDEPMGTHSATDGSHNCTYCGEAVTTCVDETPKDHECDVCGAENMGTHAAAEGSHNCTYCGEAVTTCVDETPKDHECDVCGAENMGTHAAAEGSHNCTYCGEAVNTCVDEVPKDHECDVCGNLMPGDTGCKDETGDHKCDICGGDYCGECEDASPKDHKCDYCGATMNDGGCMDETPKDHACDVCGTEIGTHEAASGKHTCDYCGEAVTTCDDADNDHDCDVCGATMGTHEAASGKHTCDYCGEAVTTCDDADNDHDCDICGVTMGTHEAASGKHTCDYCGEAVTTCDDADKDHDCDVCGAEMGTHEAASGEHTCDYCGEAVTTCDDADEDHDCDICGEAMGTHVAADGKHTCDYCGEAVTTCNDVDNDHDCDVCGAEMGTHEAASNKHTCDYCGEVLTICNDIIKDFYCDICGEIITPDITIPAVGSAKLEMETLDLSKSDVETKQSFINAGIAPGNVRVDGDRIYGYVTDTTVFRADVAVVAPCKIKISLCTWGGTTTLNTHTYKFGDTVIDCETTIAPQTASTVSVIGTVEVTEAGVYLFEFGGCNDFDYVLFEVVADVIVPVAGSAKLEMETLDLSKSDVETKQSFINAGITPGNVGKNTTQIYGYVTDTTVFRADVAVVAPCKIKISLCTWGGTTTLNTHTYKFGDTVIDCETTIAPQTASTVSVIGTVEVTEAGVYLFEFGGCNDFDHVLFEIVE